MSVVFSIAVQNPPSPECFVQTLSEEIVDKNIEDMRDAVIVICSDLAEGKDGSTWEPGYRYTFYISNLSTRGLEVTYEHDTLHVRLLTMSSVAEWDLALRMLELSADSPQRLVTNDWKPQKLTVAQLREIFHEEFVRDALVKQCARLFSDAMQHGREFQLDGPLMQFHFGPWLAHRISSGFPGDDSIEEIVNFTHDLMQVVQFFHCRFRDKNYGLPLLMDLPVDGTLYRAAVIGANDYFIPKVDYLVVPDSKTNLIALPCEEFKEELPKFFKEFDQLVWLDEHQFGLSNINLDQLYRFGKAVAPLGFSVQSHQKHDGNWELFPIQIFNLANGEKFVPAW